MNLLNGALYLAFLFPLVQAASTAKSSSGTSLSTQASPTSFASIHASSAEPSKTSIAVSSTSSVAPPVASNSTNVTIGASSSSSSFWTYRNSLFGNTTFVQTGIPPAVVNHDGQLLVMYTNKSTSQLYYALGDNDNFGSGTLFKDASGQAYNVTDSQAPALASFYGSLHAVIQQNGSLIHFIFNDTTSIWNRQSVITSSFSTPTITPYNGQLFLAMLNNTGNKLAFSFWDQESGWNDIESANGESTWGIPALYVQDLPSDPALFLLFAEDNSGRKIQGLIYNAANQTWSRISSPPSESTAFGVSSAIGEEMAFMGFQSNSGNGNIFVSVNNGSVWASHESTGQSSSDTPSMAVLNGVLNVVFNSRNGHTDILWLQRPLTNYSLESWMSVLSDTSLLSSLSIPGTHDSTAVSDVPTVGCQTMSITEQLNAGIRYFDLRSGLLNNVLIMYHGSYPIDPPFFLRLSTVISDIQAWLSTHTTEAVVVQIKQDNSPTNSTITFATAVSQVINQNAGFWNLSNTIPTLGDLRGKMQLVRRYTVNQTLGEQPIGIDVSSGWKNNNGHFDIFTPSGVHFVIQDEYQFDEDLEEIVADKSALVDSLLDEAANNTDLTTWYINFSSATHVFDASGFWIMPEDIAVGAFDIVNLEFVNGVNYFLRSELYGSLTNKRYGTILMDFPEAPEDDLIARIIATNM